MRSFTDSQGERWAIDLSVADLLALKTELNINLLDNPESLPESLGGFVDLLSVILAEQIDKRGLDAVGFARRLSGGVLNDAIECFMGELTDFFLQLQRSRGLALKGLWEKAKEVETMQEEMVEKALGQLSFGSQE